MTTQPNTLMTVDDVLTWIAKAQADIFMQLQSCHGKGYVFHRLNGAGQILDELRKHILIFTNPHGRKDIEKLKAKLKLGEYADDIQCS